MAEFYTFTMKSPVCLFTCSTSARCPCQIFLMTLSIFSFYLSSSPDYKNHVTNLMLNMRS